MLCDCGELRGINRITAASPDGLGDGGDTAATSRVSLRRVTSVSSAEVSLPFGNSAARMSGPLNPGPKPAATMS